MVYFWMIIAVCIDQAAKFVVKNYMELGETIPLIQGIFHLTSHRNPGAAWGIMAGQRWLLITIAIVVVAAGSIYAKKITNRMQQFGLGLFLGGALGNVVDRVFYGEVVDFFDIRFINYPIFNTADTAIVIGGVILAVTSWKEDKLKRTTREIE
ncbi:signal peptidase II [Brevibacillus agri]|jgi:signal peptidase II|uniref:signal peptidase II n=1 Tax=Paenibacillaceae TaxID=186822 RepID=UPI00047B7168|nr:MULTISPECIES: signal peptidase II [Brevibacillus]MED1646630.1 signal peptidase II [Brevibacillus agri]MED1657384.1 signal peptidase II [Brevibacillus agri]MED1688160.1 signal peptidase II [Brevibacillus agri]MED1695411.1 signal peptidase II [Brevibacillus agri]MED1699067.1 signal peptidase II [Brevibacillus agri]